MIPERRAAEVTPAVCKASAGAVEHIPIAQVRNLADFLAEAKEEGCWVYGAAAGARTRYDQPDYKGGVVAVLGAEGKGLRQRVASMCDDLVSLPLRGKIESLNVSRDRARCCCTRCCSSDLTHRHKRATLLHINVSLRVSDGPLALGHPRRRGRCAPQAIQA